MKGSAVTDVMGMEEEDWYEMEWCHWWHGHGRRRLVWDGALCLCMGIKEAGCYESERCYWCHGHERRLE
ncbi:hypothetical protein DPMN_163562 [Dreissena polymorpha]|uniref:Uncharacterized protein n=1 Tax=Dreissena polymorpha TaxID=45954 RepID=A0A9D4ESE9_DREPO|nr:hypothetical protein DPMN_163562 [Dreissena polymorpha]